ASVVSKLGKSAYNQLISRFSVAFRDHLLTTHGRCSKVKTILNRDAPIDIYSLYVPLYFTSSRVTVVDGSIIYRLKETFPSIIVSGLAGSGKTMFLKWASMELINSLPEIGRIPLYIELRDLTEEELASPVEKFVFEQASSESSPRTFEQFIIGIEHGLFVFVLDGLDEIAPSHREHVLSEIASFPRRYPRCPIMVSTRPDERVEGINSLLVFHVQEMSRGQIKQVVQKIPFDEEKKAEFVRRLDSNFYEEQVTFLSNPLLTTIMLMTFDNSTTIPDKRTTFYQQAFETLFYKHDSSKGIYVRRHYAELPIDEFEKLLRRFCFTTYLKSKHTFLLQDITEEIRPALERENLGDRNHDDVLRDLTETLCIMQRDGLQFIFVHRSFQEYFAARFLLYYRGEKLPQFLNGLAIRTMSDNVIPMLFEMDSELVLRDWTVPVVRREIAELREALEAGSEKLKDYLSEFLSGVAINRITWEVGLASWRGSSKLNLFMNLAVAGCPITAFVKDAISLELSHRFSDQTLAPIMSDPAVIEQSGDDRPPKDKKRRKDYLEVNLSRASLETFEKIGMREVSVRLGAMLEGWLSEITMRLEQSGTTDDALIELLDS
ncbi:MAG TPA: NACHT domain-containing protein, partial [Allosphingosinicella sp.]|nr:NACHT domain-containing protein [Allosphingosinicella sp.]